MQYIVKKDGFYAGVWRKASDKPIDLPEKVAKAFMAPAGEGIEIYVEPKAGKKAS